MSDTPITKRLHISGLTPALTPHDLSQRLSTFGTVKAVDGFGLQDGLGRPRKFGYITLETTTGQLARCLNLLSGSTWKGARLRIGEAKPDFAARLALERQAASDEPPKKKRKRSGGGVPAEDMSLVTPENVVGRGAWKVTPLGRIVRPMRMRPEKPLPPVHDVGAAKPKSKGAKAKTLGADGEEERKRKKKRVKDPDVRARRRTIDVTKWGSVHLKGMFLDMEVLGTRRDGGDEGEKRGGDLEVEDSSDGSGSGDESEVGVGAEDEAPTSPVSPVQVQTTRPIPTVPASPLAPATVVVPAVSRTLPDNNTDITLEKHNSLNLLASLFGGKEDTDWVGRESVGSDVDEDELVKGQRVLADGEAGDGDFEIVPMDTGDVDVEGDSDENAMEVEVEVPPAPPTQKEQQVTKLKDLFAPREEETGFSLLGHLDLDLELDDDVLLPTSVEAVVHTDNPEPLPAFAAQPHPSSQHQTTHINFKQALFFPLPPNSEPSIKARPKDLFDVAKENKWDWRDPDVGFFRTGTEEDVRKKWEEEKVELTKEWRRRWREAGKVSRRRRGGVGDGDE